MFLQSGSCDVTFRDVLPEGKWASWINFVGEKMMKPFKLWLWKTKIRNFFFLDYHYDLNRDRSDLQISSYTFRIFCFFSIRQKRLLKTSFVIWSIFLNVCIASLIKHITFVMRLEEIFFFFWAVSAIVCISKLQFQLQ